MPSSRARRAAARKAAADRRRRFVAAVMAIAVLGGGGAALAASLRSESDEPAVAPRPGELEDGSRKLKDRSGPIEISDEPSSYRMVYRVETYGGGDPIVTRDELTVRRPFEGRTIKRSGPDRDDDVRSEQVATLGRLFVPKAPSADAALLETGPSLAPSDVRIAPVLADLVAARRVQLREWRKVGDRPCQVLRFGGPISSGTVAATLEPDVEYADACVSEQGLVLEEVWVDGGRVQRRRLATSVEVGDDAVTSAAFEIEVQDAVPVDQGGGSFRPLAPGSAYEAPFWVADFAPLETHLGRWAVVTPAGSDPKDEETMERRLGFVADVWRSGIDVVIVEQGSTAGGVAPFQLGDGPKVKVDGVGDGEVLLDLRTSEIRFRRPGGYFLRVRGTVGAKRLEEIARSLRETPGGSGLEYTDAGR